MRGCVAYYLAALIALVLILSGITLARAYVLTGVKQNHTAITHDANPQLARAIQLWAEVSAITDGGVSTHPDIDSSITKLPSNIGGYAYWNNDNGFVTACSITVSDLYPTDMTVWVHEVGHCLGLDHSLDPHAIMYYNGGDRIGIQPDDVAAIRALYGAPAPVATPQRLAYRALLPMVAEGH